MVGRAEGKGTGAHRRRLTRDLVVRTAVEIADAGGLEALSMRALADRLGVVPMAIYKHVASKEELLDAMVDVVFSEVEVPGGVGWRRAMRERAISMRQALLRHPWAVGRMESATPGPANLRHHNDVLRCLREDAGFSFRMAVHAYSAMDSYIYGFALQEKTLPLESPEAAAEEAERRARETARVMVAETLAREFPYLVEVVAELGSGRYDYAAEFEWGLDLILDGIERRGKGDVGE